MRKYSAMFAAAALLVSSGIASAQNQMPRSNDNSRCRNVWTEDNASG